MKGHRMILIDLHMQNYKKYSDFTLTFSDGLTGIVGRNGSGKSTIFDAITFALYGDVRGEKETLRYAKSDPKDPIAVTLLFEIDSKGYKVVRQMRGKALTAKAHLYDSDDVLIAESAKGVTSEIIKLIGMTKEAFLHTVFASQKELTALSGLKNEERKKIIRKLLGLETIDKIELEIRSRLTQLNRDIKSFSEILLLESEVSTLKEQQKEQTQSLAMLQREIDKLFKNFENKSKEVVTLDKTIKAMQKSKDLFTRLSSDLKLLKQQLANQKETLSKTKDRLQVLQQKTITYEKEKYIIQNYKALEVTIADLQKQKELFLKKEGLEKEQSLLRQQYENAQKEIVDLKKNVERKAQLIQVQTDQSSALQITVNTLKEIQKKENQYNQEIAKYNGLIEENHKKVVNIEALGKDSNCPTCTRPLLEEYDKVLTSLNESIAKLHSKEILKREKKLKDIEVVKNKEIKTKEEIELVLQKLSGDIRILEEDEKRLSLKEDEFRKITKQGLTNKQALQTLQKIQYNPTTHQEIILKRDSLKSSYEELLGIKKLISQIPTLENEIKTIEINILQSDEKIKRKETEIVTLRYDATTHNAQNELYDKALHDKDLLAKKHAEKQIILTKIEGEITILKNTLNRNEAQKKQLQIKYDDKNDYEKLKAFMSEFKNKINSQIAPRISQLASELYATITRGKYQHIEVSNEFDFFIYDDGIRYPIARFSGGEVDLANLVLRIAISKTLSELTGSGGIGFLAFDEVFGSQDEERRFEIMEAFHTIKEQYRQIFLISHESEIKDMFERVVEL